MSHLILPDALRAEMVVYAREVFPEEACGLLIGTRAGDAHVLTHVRAARNLHPQRENRYYLDPLEYAKAEKFCLKHANQDWRVLGFWHSHPQSAPKPSDIDLKDALELEKSFPAQYLYLIVSLKDQNAPEIACWTLSPNKFENVPFSP